ncbi:ribose 5-phosphate isomerase B [Pseudonocardia alni]|uniref:ribose 5-phosphate isomerase B n=1 Tax=Pseudonocardia alni TaxID=33907 RepID=UPI0033FCF813
MSPISTVVIGSDHAGFHLRNELAVFLTERGFTVDNRGPQSEEETDFPDAAQEVGQAVVDSAGSARGILICGSGIGVSIAANKVKGVRAALAHDGYSAHQAVEHDDANVLCLGAQVIGPWLAKDLVVSFLGAELEHREDFLRRLAKIDALEA